MQYHVHRFFKGPYDYQPILSRIEDFKPCRYLTTFWDRFQYITFWVSIRHVQEFSHELGSDLYQVERDKWVTCYNELVGVVEICDLWFESWRSLTRFIDGAHMMFTFLFFNWFLDRLPTFISKFSLSPIIKLIFSWLMYKAHLVDCITTF